MPPTLTYSDPRDALDRGASGVLRWLGITAISLFMGLGLLAGGSFLTALVLGPAGAAIGAWVMLAVALTTAVAARRLRRARAARICSYLEQAVRNDLPLPEMLHLAAEAEEGTTRRRLRELGRQLAGGASLPVALERAVPEIPPRSAALIAAADRAGTLTRTLHELVDDDLRTAPRPSLRGSLLLVYVLLVGTALFAVILMLTLFVLPKFDQIFRDFGQGGLPPLTRAIGWTSRALAPAAVVVLIFMIFFLAGRAWRDIFHVAPRTQPLRAPLDQLAWITPFFGGLARDRGMADVCTILADGLRAGRPLSWLLAEAAQPHLNRVLASRVIAWLESWSAGERLSVAARQARMPSLVVNMLGDVHDASHAADTFDFLARYYRSRATRGGEFLQGLAVPLVAIGGGAIVLAVALGIYLPLIRLIDIVAPYKVGL